jgi:hypothetical protein
MIRARSIESMINMLDPPTPFATRETWERHLAYLH